MRPEGGGSIRGRAAVLFDEHRRRISIRTSRLFAVLMVLQWIAAIAAALWISPLAWAGRTSQTHIHVWSAILLGGAISGFPVLCALFRPAATSTRHVVALGQVLMSALAIHLCGGRIESHFHVFGSLAFIACYRDWTLFVPATIVIAADHYLRGAYWPESVYGVLSVDTWRWLEHASWVLFEDVFLVINCVQSVREMRRIASQRAELEIVNETTERVVIERTAELRESRKHALDAVELKSQFLASMSHEIRTPMNVIIGMTEMTLDSTLDTEQASQVRTVHSYACSLLALLNDILDLSKIEAGKVEVEAVPFHLRETLDDLLTPLAARAHERRIELACDVAPDVPNMLVGDPRRLRQVLTNLVGNAIKFTEAGEVTVRAMVETADDAEIVLHVAVSDTGIGIPPEKHGIIFAPFVQVDGSMSRRYGGTGLGLSIAARLVDLMLGRIWVESEPGRGSTFHFTARLRLDALARAVSDRHPSDVSGLHVLVVDDSATTRTIIADMLASHGAVTTLTDRPAVALRALREARARGRRLPVVLIDADLPGGDGLELVRCLRRDPPLATTPVVLLTSGRRPDEARALDVAGYVAKPVAEARLLNTLRTVAECDDDVPLAASA